MFAGRHAGGIGRRRSNGEVVLNKGMASRIRRRTSRLIPATHLFRAASVSKLFTATAVMQLVEQGKLNLDANVNEYLKEEYVPYAFLGEPVTLRNLLQHAAGLDDEFLGMARETPENLPPLDEYLRHHLPQRVFRPGALCELLQPTAWRLRGWWWRRSLASRSRSMCTTISSRRWGWSTAILISCPMRTPRWRWGIGAGCLADRCRRRRR